MQRSRLHSGRYCNWVKTSLSLCYLREGITEFSNVTAKDFQRTVSVLVALKCPHAATTKCGACTYQQAVKTKTKDKKAVTWRMDCRMNICSVWLDELLPYHKQHPFPKIAWENSDPCLWPTDAWEVAKLFQPYGEGRKLHIGAENDDAFALLSLIQDCSFFSKFIVNPTVIKDIKKIRNNCLHSSDFEISDADMTQSLNMIISFMEEPHLKKYPSCRAAVEKIEELRDNVLDLSLNRELELKAIHNKILAINQKMESMTNSVTDLRDEMKDNTTDQNATIESYRETLDNFGDSLNEVKDNLRVLQQLQDSSVSDKVTALTEQLKDLESNTAQANNRIDEFYRAKMATLEAEIHGMKIQMRGIHQRSHVTRSRITDLRVTLLNLYKKGFQCLPVYSVNPVWKHQLCGTYFTPDLRRIDAQYALRPNEDNVPLHLRGKMLSGISEIFFNVKDGNLCKNVFVSADAGAGKTSLCEHIVSVWCDAYSAADSANSTNDTDIQTMLKFQLLFYISLRNASVPSVAPENDEIATLIYKELELSAENYSIYDIIECLSEETTLVLMDSLDELGSTRPLRRGMHNNSCIVMTSRPWKLEVLRPHIVGTIDQHIGIVGFVESSPTDFIQTVINILNRDDGDTKRGEQFVDDMERKGLGDLLNIPDIVMHLLNMWISGECVGKSLFEIYGKLLHHQILAAIKTYKLPELASKVEHHFPLCCSKVNCPCKMYSDLMWKCASLAYYTLFGFNRETSLVFDSKSTIRNEFSEEEIEISLKLGLLTQHTSIVKNLRTNERSFNFPHRTIQEYFASIFLAYRREKSDMEHFVYITFGDLDRALELEKVLVFTSHLDPNLTRQLSYLIAKEANNDARVQEYRTGTDRNAPNRHLIETIQNIIVHAAQLTQENIKSTVQGINAIPSQEGILEKFWSIVGQPKDSNTSKNLFLSDIYIKSSLLFQDFDESRPVDVNMLEMSAVKSLHIQNTSDVKWDLFEMADSLETLVLEKCKVDYERIHRIILRNKDTLRALGLGGYSDLDLSRQGDSLSMFNATNLRCLVLEHVTLSHSQYQGLAEFMSTLSNLTQLVLRWVACKTHGVVSGCSEVKLDCNITLESMRLECLSLSGLLFHAEKLRTFELALPVNVIVQRSALDCLRSATNLNELTCTNLRGDSVRMLVTILPHLSSLKKLMLRKIDFGSTKDACFSRLCANAMDSIKLWNSTITLQCLRCLVQARWNMVELGAVIIRDKDPREFLQHLRASQKSKLAVDEGVEFAFGEWEIKHFMIYF